LFRRSRCLKIKPVTTGTGAAEHRPTRVRELFLLFGRLGVTAFGGPAAHIAMMHDEVVRRRAWLTGSRFVDLVGATNLVPGPNSTELAIHIGYQRAGWRGLVVAGACFIGPAAIMVGVLAWAYQRYGQLAQARWLLYGVSPVVIAIIGVALARLATTAVRGLDAGLVAVAVLVGSWFGVNELALLGGGGLGLVLVRRWPPRTWRRSVRPNHRGLVGPALLVAGAHASWPDLIRLFLTMLKIGSVLFGSGYVLVAFLRGDFVQRLGWLTDQQLLDAVAVGQITPGPLFTSATFVGYLVGGVPGAILATVAIFTPAFVLARYLGTIVTWIRARAWSSHALDGVNAAAVALMAVVAMRLARLSFVDPLTVVVALAAAVVLWRVRLNSGWLILAGAGLGVLHGVLV
jgi:chromate transporter